MPQLDPEKQRGFAVEVVCQLRQRGFEAYWAGGCVRDQLLGRLPKDYDVATTAQPPEIREIFGPRRTLALGAAFGVITVVGPRPAGQIEVTTFRQDAAYTDSRHPDFVEFSTPRADAERRDFTINGLFYDPVEHRVIDFVGGQEDLVRRVVRAIGDPHARFSEDRLRLLRAIRFASVLDFALDPGTNEAIGALAPGITAVSAERIAAELRLMLTDASRARAVTLLRESGLLDAILPEISAADASKIAGAAPDAAWQATLAALQALTTPSFPLALAILLHGSLDAAASYQVCRRWKLSNRETQRTTWLVENQHALRGARQMPWPRLQRLLISEGIDELLALDEAVAMAERLPTDDVSYCRELLRMPREQLDPPPLLSGNDLITHGVPRGKHYQTLLEAVRDAQLEKRVGTKAEALALVDRLRSNRQDGAT